MGKRTDDRIRVKWGDWLNRRFAALINERGRVMTVYEFADYLQEARQNVDKWLAGKAVPLGSSVINIANKLGPEVYDVLEIPRPTLPAGDLIDDLLERLPEVAEKDPKLFAELVEAVRAVDEERGAGWAAAGRRRPAENGV